MNALHSAVMRFVVEFGPSRTPPEPIVPLILAVIQKRHPGLYAQFDPTSDSDRWRVRDVVIAYGCGFEKIDVFGVGEWKHTWPKAHQEFTSMVDLWVGKTASWLEFTVFIDGSERGWQVSLRTQVTAIITFLLVNGRCRCFGRAARWEDESGEAGSDSSEGPGDNRCLTEHNLLEWDPSKMSLTAFIARAVKGSLTSKGSGKQLFSTGGLLQGLYYNLWGRAAGLRAGHVLLWRCPRDGARNLYGRPCRICKRTAGQLLEALSNARFMTSRRIILPSAAGGSFHPVKLWKCSHCGRRYFAKSKVCPRDRRPPGKGEKPSVVWICTSGPNVDLDAQSEEEDGGSVRDYFYLPGNQPDMARLLDAKALLPTLTGNQRLELMALLEAYL